MKNIIRLLVSLLIFLLAGCAMDATYTGTHGEIKIHLNPSPAAVDNPISTAELPAEPQP